MKLAEYERKRPNTVQMILNIPQLERQGADIQSKVED